MTTQLLIYERALPVSKERHRDWSVKVGTDFTFARRVNAVPLMAGEFPRATAEYAIVFAGTEESVMPTVILGVQNRQNLYLTDTGAWRAKYVPAFLRRYPFVFSGSDGGKSFTLCIDEQYAGCNQEGRGERLFDSDGERTQYLAGVLDFLQAYQSQFKATQAFCRRLKELSLLEPAHAQFTLGTGERTSLAGFMAVNRERLKALSAEELAELVKTDVLELVYLHLQSMRNLSTIAERVAPHASEREQAALGGQESPVGGNESAEKHAPSGKGIH